MAANAVAGDLLCLILDLNPASWAQSAHPSPGGDALSLDQALDHVLVFCNAHLALRHENEVAVFGATIGSSRQLFSSQLTPTSSSSAPFFPSHDSNIYQQFRVVDERIAAGIKGLIADMPEDSDRGVNLVGALSMALCHINRLATSDSLTSSLRKAQPRIVILSVTQDSSTQYVPVMNCIFTAQKSNIQIDVCKILGPDAVFLQQACHLTGGAYYKLQRRAGLLQYLMTGFLPGPAARKHLTQPKQEQVDLRAACFCHRKIVDIGYVCSVCLSIFCSPLPVCSTCRSVPLLSLVSSLPLRLSPPVFPTHALLPLPLSLAPIEHSTKFPMSTLKRLGFGVGANRPAPPPLRAKKRKAPPLGGPGGEGARASPASAPGERTPAGRASAGASPAGTPGPA
ncbi:SPOSA6832_04535 [Sporobolomyces salmonicolor]|uniref:General transcription and DNA repair factor IIH subunit TFB4 n=1 Tax=Sporidiobolus salmonicolor TaxID=5005 RepID=A0A0D6ERY0_SPOSA|nr:SPOSA6832_04535 [Sporobolomyces salmonicolor]